MSCSMVRKSDRRHVILIDSTITLRNRLVFKGRVFHRSDSAIRRRSDIDGSQLDASCYSLHWFLVFKRVCSLLKPNVFAERCSEGSEFRSYRLHSFYAEHVLKKILEAFGLSYALRTDLYSSWTAAPRCLFPPMVRFCNEGDLESLSAPWSFRVRSVPLVSLELAKLLRSAFDKQRLGSEMVLFGRLVDHHHLKICAWKPYNRMRTSTIRDLLDSRLPGVLRISEDSRILLMYSSSSLNTRLNIFCWTSQVALTCSVCLFSIFFRIFLSFFQ